METEEKPKYTHQDCVSCGHKGCVTIWSKGSYCHSCKVKVGSVPKEIAEEDLTDKFASYRGIDLDVVKKYGVRTSYDDKGSQVRRVYPYPHMDKYRYLPKDFSKNRGFKNNHLFGMDKFNAGSSQFITIVEGEDDVPSAYQMLGKKYPVVGLPGSSVSSALLQNCHKYLDSFKSIIVCADGDEAGSSVADKVAAAFPNKVYKVNLTKHNDPNDFLKAGDDREFLYAWVNREKHTPAGITNTPGQFKKVIAEEFTNDYVPTPCEALNDKIKGLMQGHLTVITGPEGQGKTEVLRWFEYSILKTTDKSIAVLHMEESKKTAIMSYLCYELGLNVRDPDHVIPEATIDKAVDDFTKDERLFLFDFNMDEDPLHILDKVRYFSEACDCDFIFIDPIQQLSYGKDREASEEKTLSQIAVQLGKLASQLNVGIVMTTHVNDDGAIRSSRMIGKAASVRIDLNRDHMNPDKDLANTTFLAVTKNRPTSLTGFGGTLKFNPDTFTLRDL